MNARLSSIQAVASMQQIAEFISQLMSTRSDKPKLGSVAEERLPRAVIAFAMRDSLALMQPLLVGTFRCCARA